MKNLKFQLALTVFAGMLILSSCKKEEQTVDPVPTPPIANTDHFGENIILSSIGGVINDESGNGVANADVRIGTNLIQTDDNGVFLFRDIQVNEKRTYLTVSKNGFFHGSRVLYPSVSSVSYVDVMLLSNSSVGNFSSASGGAISSNGVSLNFPANAIKVEGGGAYSGVVNVALKFLDPNSDDMAEQMPGDLMAVNSSNQLRVLETYGMAAVELTSPTGQKLNIADGKKVELKIPLSGAYLTDAPSSIPLWYFDETTGIWKEEGTATKVGNEYVGEVSHFTFWNCDFPGARIAITGTVMCGTSPFANAHVWLRSSTGRVLGHGTTNSLGVFNGFTQSGTALTVEVTSNGVCSSTILYSASAGPFTSATTLPTINACAATSLNNGILNVTLMDCSSSPVTNGVLEVNIGGRKSYYFPDALGNINANIVYCTYSSIDIQAFDYTNSKQSVVQTVTTGATMNVGNLPVCGAIDEYVTYNLDGTNYRIDKIPVNQVYHYSWSGNTNISAFDGVTRTNYFTAKISGASIGTYALQADSGSLVNGLVPAAASTSMNATFTTYGTTPGTYIIGTFTGTFTDVASTAHTLSGSFRLKNP